MGRAMNSTLSSTRTFNTDALVKSTNLDSSFQLQNAVLQPRFTVAVRAELMRMTGHIEDVVEMFKKATAYLPLQRSHLAFSPAKKQVLRCRSYVLEGITGAVPKPMQ
jgi:hypothetical protein